MAWRHPRESRSSAESADGPDVGEIVEKLDDIAAEFPRPAKPGVISGLVGESGTRAEHRGGSAARAASTPKADPAHHRPARRPSGGTRLQSRIRSRTISEFRDVGELEHAPHLCDRLTCTVHRNMAVIDHCPEIDIAQPDFRKHAEIRIDHDISFLSGMFEADLQTF